MDVLDLFPTPLGTSLDTPTVKSAPRSGAPRPPSLDGAASGPKPRARCAGPRQPSRWVGAALLAGAGLLVPGVAAADPGGPPPAALPPRRGAPHLVAPRADPGAKDVKRALTPEERALRGVVVVERAGQPLGLGVALMGDGRILYGALPARPRQRPRRPLRRRQRRAAEARPPRSRLGSRAPRPADRPLAGGAGGLLQGAGAPGREHPLLHPHQGQDRRGAHRAALAPHPPRRRRQAHRRRHRDRLARLPAGSRHPAHRRGGARGRHPRPRLRAEREPPLHARWRSARRSRPSRASSARCRPPPCRPRPGSGSRACAENSGVAKGVRVLGVHPAEPGGGGQDPGRRSLRERRHPGGRRRAGDDARGARRRHPRPRRGREGAHHALQPGQVPRGGRRPPRRARGQGGAPRRPPTRPSFRPPTTLPRPTRLPRPAAAPPPQTLH